jgi:hypothetical protein
MEGSESKFAQIITNPDPGGPKTFGSGTLLYGTVPVTQKVLVVIS